MHSCRTMILTDNTKPDIISFCQVTINDGVETYKFKGFIPNIYIKPMPATLKAKQGRILLDKILEKNGIASKSYRILKWSQCHFGAKVTLEPSREFIQEIWNRQISQIFLPSRAYLQTHMGYTFLSQTRSLQHLYKMLFSSKPPWFQYVTDTIKLRYLRPMPDFDNPGSTSLSCILWCYQSHLITLRAYLFLFVKDYLIIFKNEF